MVVFNEFKHTFLTNVHTIPFRHIQQIAQNVTKAFPRAITNAELVSKVTGALSSYGYGDSSLLATSLCCDEVNRVLEKDFSAAYGDNFSMGGLAGFPFGGVVSFGAMAHHIPTDGSCLIVYGPHVGIDKDGNVGLVERRGIHGKSCICCGSAAAAAGYVASVHSGESPPPSDLAPAAVDAQQAYVGSLLLPHAARLAKSPEPNVELPLALYDAQKEMMEEIVAKGCQEVGGDGKIALLGGIQINTVEGESDYFLPLDFKVMSNKAALIKDLNTLFN